jgi:hypothetical protein
MSKHIMKKMSKESLNNIKQPEFNDRKENYNILEEITSIQSQRTMYKYDEIKLMHQDFAEQNPELFEKCTRENIKPDDIKKMVYMLDLRKQVKEGKISFEKASNIFSMKMAKEFQPELLQKNGFKKRK